MKGTRSKNRERSGVKSVTNAKLSEHLIIQQKYLRPATPGKVYFKF